jgi:hypothetical protein
MESEEGKLFRATCKGPRVLDRPIGRMLASLQFHSSGHQTPRKDGSIPNASRTSRLYSGGLIAGEDHRLLFGMLLEIGMQLEFQHEQSLSTRL